MNILEIAAMNEIRTRLDERRNFGSDEAYAIRVLLRSASALGALAVLLALLEAATV